MRTSRVLTSLMLAALCVAIAGTVAAASIESLVMPGPVIEGHAELEEECSSCHDLFDRGAQRTLCLDCHEPVAEDLTAGEGFHGRHAQASSADCKQCHAEHKGRSADITGLQPALFDHSITDFELTGAHTKPDCAACHQPDTRYADAPSDCVGCHEVDDVHLGNLGSQCVDCHEVDVWRSGQFDHATTDFELTGKHAQASCIGCHADQLYEALETACIDCHRLDDVHGGARGDACADCHNSESWETRFDHEAETDFALAGAHASLECRNCHVSETDYEGLPTDCVGCHSGDDVHLGRNGSECESCHEQSDWVMRFDHLAETDYELEGAHADQACTACHTGNLTDPLPVDCVNCHAADDPHEDTLLECASCHGQTSWEEENRFHHDLTSFPLVGLHRTASCEQCHDTLAYSPTEMECVACHEDEDAHSGGLGETCESCHNPVGWDYWQFDHDTQTDFALSGSHENLVCEACHAPGDTLAKLPVACVTCHRGDDVHRGGFGQKCDQCHNTETFSDPVFGS